MASTCQIVPLLFTPLLASYRSMLANFPVFSVTEAWEFRGYDNGWGVD